MLYLGTKVWPRTCKTPLVRHWGTRNRTAWALRCFQYSSNVLYWALLVFPTVVQRSAKDASHKAWTARSQYLRKPHLDQAWHIDHFESYLSAITSTKISRILSFRRKIVLTLRGPIRLVCKVNPAMHYHLTVSTSWPMYLCLLVENLSVIWNKRRRLSSRSVGFTAQLCLRPIFEPVLDCENIPIRGIIGHSPFKFPFHSCGKSCFCLAPPQVKPCLIF